jgi:photosystem II stability/assembly factor-like uncharacterized protein
MKHLVFFLCIISSVSAQKIDLVATKNGVSFRGLSAVNEKVVWVSGNKGIVGRTIDGGTTWNWIDVPGYSKTEFRDIEAFDAHTAIIMAVGEPALILKTTDDGLTWRVVYKNETPGMFLDAMEFWNDESGIVVGDPINGKFFVARTFDNGNNWRPLPSDKLPDAQDGEAMFAASGTNVRALDRDEACFVTGGRTTRMFWKGDPIVLPVISGKESQGANSVAVWYKNKKSPHITVVGGDFNIPDSREKNCSVSLDGGKSWIKPTNPPYGYRSCVDYISEKKLITCGLNGVDVSLNDGINWNNISHDSYNVCRKAKKGKAVYLAGQGKVAKLTWE